MQKLIYITNVRLPTEKAHGIQVMKMCEAFADNGIKVSLTVPSRRNQIREDGFKYYSVKENFNIHYLPCFDTVVLGKIGFWFQSVSFAFSCLPYILNERDAYFYTRDGIIAWLLSLLGVRFAYEAHAGYDNFFVRSLIKKDSKIICISSGLRSEMISRGAKPQNVFTAPDGVDFDMFSLPGSKAEARMKVGFNTGDRVVLYTGHFYSWKGADTLALSAGSLPPECRVVFVGGTDDEIKSFNKKYGNIKNLDILGRKPYRDIPMFLKAADVLILPNTGMEEISRIYTSPMKLFEYMASGTPIVASDIPSLREVLNESNCYFFKPDSPESLASTICSVLADEVKSEAIGSQASHDSLKYSWSERAKSIFSFIASGDKIAVNNIIVDAIKKIFGKRIVRYVFSGGTAAAVDLTVLFILVNIFSVWYLVSSVAAFLVAFLVSFTLQKFFTFNEFSNSRTRFQMTLFLTVSLLNLVANTVLMYVTVDYIHIHYILAQILTSGFIAVYSFFVYRNFVFHGKFR